MGGFNTHIKYGWKTHTLTTIILTPIYFQISFELIIALIGISIPITLLGSIIPDIDHPSSKTYRIFKYTLLCFTIIITSILLQPYQNTITNIYLLIINEIYAITIPITIATISILNGIIITKIFEKIRPPHRGITHNKTFGLTISIILLIITYILFNTIQYQEYNIIISSILSIYLFAGFLSHLYCDKILF